MSDWHREVAGILAEARGLGFTDGELEMPSFMELVEDLLAEPGFGRLGLSPKCYRGGGFTVHVQPDCRCRKGWLR